jgi:hypothetical protein
LVGKSEGRKKLAKPTYKLEGDIKMDLRDIRYASVEWIKLTKEGVQ